MDVSHNQLTGTPSPHLGESRTLVYLLMAGNQLSGHIPDCWRRMENLTFVDLSSNNLTGRIPSTMGSMVGLHTLHLNNNSFTGRFPLSLRKCQAAEFLHSYFALRRFQLLDLAENELTGSIPRSIGGLTAMVIRRQQRDDLDSNAFGYSDSVSLMWKGEMSFFKQTLSLVPGIDLSCNFLSEEIPSELTNLSGLVYPNLSRNDLTGSIPSAIGNLDLIESLDLSRNQLSGAKSPGASCHCHFWIRSTYQATTCRGECPPAINCRRLAPQSTTATTGSVDLRYPTSARIIRNGRLMSRRTATGMKSYGYISAAADTDLWWVFVDS
ncbi:hypothetical protein B296_00040012 [Ensete ventricosum]|uniref:Leucine-rich repeat-containing N-terminal plant-type domain-containing protein n=1 Tax=Ensete ventricosum TaxID=4639 RepID=A0A426XAT0_ENSVE|nr:hypothetical protein B296_00040012 [Ensete ventricosum]